MIVADTNLIVSLAVPSQRTALAEAVLARDPEWAAPLLWRSEFRNVLAGQLRRGTLAYEDALEIARHSEERMTGAEYTVSTDRVLRLVATSRCSAYDCEFVALAEDLAAPLVTSDRQILQEFADLARSPEQFLAGV